MKPQVARLLEVLRERGDEGITSLQALHAGCGSRLAARVADLRAEGYEVSSELIRLETGARVALYVLHERIEPVQLDLFSDRHAAPVGARAAGASPRSNGSRSHQVARTAIAGATG